MTRPLLFGVAVVVAAGAWLALASQLDRHAGRGGAADAAPAPPATRPALAVPASAVPAGTAAVQPTPGLASPADRDSGSTKPAAGGGVLVLPTGKRVRALNGVRTEIRLLWPAERPYSPITGITTQVDGIQWYVHADGSHSTTQMVYRSDLGRRTAMSMVANPHAVLPLQPHRDAGPDSRR